MGRTSFVRLVWRSVVSLLVVGALMGLAPAGAAASQGAGGAFNDDDGSVHEAALDALASRGVLAGTECGDKLICPGAPLRRWEMAVWLVRVLDGANPGSADSERFSDLDYQQWWAPFVERLFDLGVTSGCRLEPLRYCPDRAVTRAEMATFLARAFDLEPAAPAGFTDVAEGPHAASINALAAAGITAGCVREPLQYCPADGVTRGQMASFVARAMGVIESPADVRVSGIDAGWWHSCGLRVDGSIDCWGSNPFGQADAPAGEFSALTAGAHHSCGLRDDGSAECWGSNIVGQLGAPAGRFVALSAGWGHTCGVRTDQYLECWGVNWNGRADPPVGQFSVVAAGDEFTCGLRVDGSIDCWGRLHDGQIPAGRFSAIAVGRRHSCAVQVQGAIACWGANWSGQAAAPDGRFSAVAVGLSHSCAVRIDAAIVCWGSNGLGQAEAPPGYYLAVATGYYHSCGLRSVGDVVCWGDNYFGQLNVPEGQFQAVTADREYSCGLRTDGTVECWGLAQVVHPPTDVVTGAEPALAGLGECQQRGTRNNTTAGFPLPRSALASTGTLRVAVLFVDFPNAIAPYSTLDEADRSLGFIEGFLEASSYGRLDIELRPHHRWLRARHDYDHYLHGSSLGSQSLQLGIAEEAARIADPDFDFSGVDALMVVHPSVYFGGGGTGQERIETQEGEVQTLLINTFRVEGRPSAQQWGDVAAHELVHNLGLADLYPYDARRHEPHVEAGDRTWFLTEFGPMGLRAYGPSGRAGYREAIEMLAWSRWQLGWLDEAQIRCIEEPIATVTLSPVADPGDGIAMAAVPLSDTEVIVIESRRSLGYDSGALLDEGVLVYTVDAMISSGLLPMKLAGDPGNAHFDDYPLLKVGESVTVRGYTITVDTDDGNTHTVTVTRDEQG
ncbi:MAG: hypothetical protein F4Z00_07995 [Acidimicrobiaceae bacterium]|nr:hypothetical protein [Acidimicrobiaceae bacterium]MXZ65478.1 hypothetical protein [Acidimicrobiaceae bacterium]MYG77286.1 hypothetical protein [Acidimicrobiaceae bacterium]MYJ30813.1 hypothetical protein [Acidimicrobiaceae bacterium]